MATAAAKGRGRNEPEVRPIIIKKIIAEGHGGHHGGAWKVAYADFVTAMMAFFLLLWILGATTEKQRKGIADYFTPTLVEMRQKSAGANGPFGGDSITAKDNYPHRKGETGTKSLTIPRDATGGPKEGAETRRNRDRTRFKAMRKAIEQKIASDKRLERLKKSVRFLETRDGLRIDLVEQADFSMFALGTDRILPEARDLLRTVAIVVREASNDVIVTGHTDALPYAAGRTVNNWTLSSARAEATRKVLADSGVGGRRFSRIEGVADREPYVPADRYDPRNRRMSITLAWSKAIDPAGDAAEAQAARDEEGRPGRS
ncbi:flagellar motor protein MotB [Sphingomonas sp. 1P06PA]|uniref:flagellar motor protein MotB n=1 Tax=Sphingomonas sp. 1P06PA TaxID=554121 RepID=UPI0039A46E03